VRLDHHLKLRKRKCSAVRFDTTFDLSEQDTSTISSVDVSAATSTPAANGDPDQDQTSGMSASSKMPSGGKFLLRNYLWQLTLCIDTKVNAAKLSQYILEWKCLVPSNNSVSIVDKGY